VDDLNTPGDNGRLSLNDESGMTRRDLMKRGAVVGGTLLWVAPAIQSYGSKAFAQDNGSPGCDACVSVTLFAEPGPPPPQTFHVIFDATTDCCDCIDAAGSDLGAIFECFQEGDCDITGTPQPGPCPG
jgi:hypothetical protein